MNKEKFIEKAIDLFEETERMARTLSIDGVPVAWDMVVTERATNKAFSIERTNLATILSAIAEFHDGDLDLTLGVAQDYFFDKMGFYQDLEDGEDVVRPEPELCVQLFLNGKYALVIAPNDRKFSMDLLGEISRNEAAKPINPNGVSIEDGEYGLNECIATWQNLM